MLCQPGTCLQAVMTAEIVGEHEDIADRVISLNIFEQLDILLGIARCGTTGKLLAIAHAQRPRDPDLGAHTAAQFWRDEVLLPSPRLPANAPVHAGFFPARSVPVLEACSPRS